LTEDQLGLKGPSQEPSFMKSPAWMVLVPFFLSAFFYFSTVMCESEKIEGSDQELMFIG